ncbi:MAG: glutathione S-transferase family protein [Rhodobacterales bacterium]|nr:glutathione S-transferase family protein [Rhodobacterales bacterium]
MRTLFHMWLDPFSRKARVVLGEKGLEFTLRLEATWERREAFLALNPACTVPVLVEEDGTALSGSSVICEYLDEAHPDPPLIGEGVLDRAEVRRLVLWFDRKFQAEVTKNLVGEKMIKRLRGGGEPDSAAVRAGHANLHVHLSYIAYLLEHRDWLAGDRPTLADMAAAAHLSSVDYLGDVPWSDHPAAKDWYARMKSRPSFRPILNDLIPGAPPPKHYADPDF